MRILALSEMSFSRLTNPNSQKGTHGVISELLLLLLTRLLRFLEGSCRRKLIVYYSYLDAMESWLRSSTWAVDIIATRSRDHKRGEAERILDDTKGVLEDVVRLKDAIYQSLSAGKAYSDFDSVRTRVNLVKPICVSLQNSVNAFREDDSRQVSGTAQVMEFYGICPQILRTESEVVQIVTEAAKREGMKVESVGSKVFTPNGGLTITLILSMSGLIFDSWPEYNYAGCIVMTCGKKRLDMFTFLRKALRAESARMNTDGQLKIKYARHNESLCPQCAPSLAKVGAER